MTKATASLKLTVAGLCIVNFYWYRKCKLCKSMVQSLAVPPPYRTSNFLFVRGPVLFRHVQTCSTWTLNFTLNGPSGYVQTCSTPLMVQGSLSALRLLMTCLIWTSLSRKPLPDVFKFVHTVHQQAVGILLQFHVSIKSTSFISLIKHANISRYIWTERSTGTPD